MSNYDEQLEALLMAHRKVCEQIGKNKITMAETEFAEGHKNGVKEARNRVEETIQELYGVSDEE